MSLKPSLAGLALVLTTALPLAAIAAELPKPNSNGDYSSKTSHRSWVVVDPDPKGLNCRWSRTVPSNWYDPRVQWPNRTFAQWSVVRRFNKGTVLTSNTTPAGFASTFDNRNLPWLKVSIGPDEQICLVRANSRFIRPVQ